MVLRETDPVWPDFLQIAEMHRFAVDAVVSHFLRVGDFDQIVIYG